MRRIAFLGLALALGSCPRPVRAHDGSDSGSGSPVTADFLRAGPGARAAAMGDAHAAAVDDASALYWNTAALALIEKRSVTASHAAVGPGMMIDYGAFALGVASGVSVGASVQYAGYGTLTETNQIADEIGQFKPNDLAFSLGGAWRGESGWSFGAAAKLVRMTITKTASTGAADLGVLSPPLLGGALRLGGSVSNLAGRIKFRENPERLPVITRGGAGWRPSARWLLAADVVMETDRSAYADAGLERLLSAPGAAVLIAGRAGFTSRDWGMRSGMDGASAGLGFGFTGLRVDYAFVVRPGDPGHRASLAARF